MKNREQRPKSDKALRQLSSGNKIKLGEVYRSVTSASLAHFPYKSAWAERTRQRALRARNKQTSRCARVACRSANPCRKRETKENEKKKAEKSPRRGGRESRRSDRRERQKPRSRAHGRHNNPSNGGCGRPTGIIYTQSGSEFCHDLKPEIVCAPSTHTYNIANIVLLLIIPHKSGACEQWGFGRSCFFCILIGNKITEPRCVV